MKTFSKTLIAAAAFTAIATTAFSQVPWEFNPGMAYMYAGPGKMSAMAMAATPKNHDAMMKNAKKVPSNTRKTLRLDQRMMAEIIDHPPACLKAASAQDPLSATCWAWPGSFVGSGRRPWSRPLALR